MSVSVALSPPDGGNGANLYFTKYCIISQYNSTVNGLIYAVDSNNFVPCQVISKQVRQWDWHISTHADPTSTRRAHL